MVVMSFRELFNQAARLEESQPEQALAVWRELEDAVFRSFHEENEAFETLMQARSEAGRVAGRSTAPASDLGGTLPDLEKTISEEAKTLSEIDKTIPDFDKEYATEVLEIGFGGVLSGR